MFKNAVQLSEVFGFKLKVDPSWLLIAALIVWSLSTSYFPQALPGGTATFYTVLGIIAMLGMFASLILHELSHSLVARSYGLKVGGITLFIFGGVAELLARAAGFLRERLAHPRSSNTDGLSPRTARVKDQVEAV